MNYRLFLLFLTILICLVLSVVVNVSYGIDIVYTHLFYIPIVLTGIWYPRYAVFLGAALGLIHIACDYATAETFKIGVLIRAAMFMLVGYVTSYLALRRDHLLNSMRESEERYRTLVENASDIIFRTDNNGHFTFVNPAALRITGYEEAEIIGKHYSLLIHPDMRNEAIKFFGRQFIKRIQNTYLEYPPLTKEGHELWFGQNTQLLVEDGHVTGFQAVARDITERKRAEEALEEERRRLQQALDEVRTLRGIVPICANCKQIRDDKGYWNQVEKYVSDHTEAKFTYGICPDCVEILYPKYKKQ